MFQYQENRMQSIPRWSFSAKDSVLIPQASAFSLLCHLFFLSRSHLSLLPSLARVWQSVGGEFDPGGT